MAAEWIAGLCIAYVFGAGLSGFIVTLPLSWDSPLRGLSIHQKTAIAVLWPVALLVSAVWGVLETKDKLHLERLEKEKQRELEIERRYQRLMEEVEERL